SPCGRGAGGEGETFQPSEFHVKLTPMASAVPLQSVAFFFKIGIIQPVFILHPLFGQQIDQNRLTVKTLISNR
ncbi:hypothetical protein, partial [Tolypothrix sp. PCC 7601]|uniref:hypothetical protein n=1 Tax=Tolypothrix sp. PCC 7601 TaxID=1188 RepID=UPI0005EAB186